MWVCECVGVWVCGCGFGCRCRCRCGCVSVSLQEPQHVAACKCCLEITNCLLGTKVYSVVTSLISPCVYVWVSGCLGVGLSLSLSLPLRVCVCVCACAASRTGLLTFALAYGGMAAAGVVSVVLNFTSTRFLALVRLAL